MNPLFLGLAAGLAVINWLSVQRGWRLIDTLTIPAFGSSLAVAWLVAQNGRWDFFSTVILLAILFSAAGDVALMIPGDRFLAGLLFFLAALFSYITGLNLVPPPANASSILLAAIPLALFFRLGAIVQKGLEQQQKTGLKIPVLVYACGLTAFLISCLGTLSNPDWQPTAAFLTAGGGTLFYMSDVILAWNRFVRPLQKALLKNRILYQLGQLALVTGLVWQG